MTKIESYYKFLQSEQLEPRLGKRAEQIWFRFQGELFELFVADDDTLIMFRQGVVGDQFPERSTVARAVNKINIRYSLVTAWYFSNYAVTSIPMLCASPEELVPHLYRILEQLDSATVRLRSLLFDDGALEQDDVDDLDEADEVNDDAPPPKAVDSVQALGVPQKREAILMNPSRDTGNKLRWESQIDGLRFTFYVPKRRVPVPWPKQIVVAVSELPLVVHEMHTAASAEPIDTHLPIVTTVGLDYRCLHSVRYRPIGEPATWEIGTTYIPYSLLRSDVPPRLQIEVRWDYTAGHW